MNHPPVAAFDSNSIVVGNLPIQFEWRSKALEVEQEMNVCRSNDQIMQELNPPRESEMNRGDTLNGRRKTQASTAGKGKGVDGPAQFGLSIDNLFSHSYTPPTQKKQKPAPSPSTS